MSIKPLVIYNKLQNHPLIIEAREVCKKDGPGLYLQPPTKFGETFIGIASIGNLNVREAEIIDILDYYGYTLWTSYRLVSGDESPMPYPASMLIFMRKDYKGKEFPPIPKEESDPGKYLRAG